MKATTIKAVAKSEPLTIIFIVYPLSFGLFLISEVFPLFYINLYHVTNTNLLDPFLSHMLDMRDMNTQTGSLCTG